MLLVCECNSELGSLAEGNRYINFCTHQANKDQQFLFQNTRYTTVFCGQVNTLVMFLCAVYVTRVKLSSRMKICSYWV